MTTRDDEASDPSKLSQLDPARRDQIASEFLRLLTARLDSHFTRFLPQAWDPEAAPIELDPELSSFIGLNRSALLALLSAAPAPSIAGWSSERELSETLCSRVEAAMYRHNQFLHFDAKARTALETVLGASIAALRAALLGAQPDALAGAVRDVYRKEQSILAQLLRLQFGPLPPGVVSAEYDPSLQLRILGLNWQTLCDPVLDIGCGSRAALVRAMREQGHEALGIDREAPEGIGIRADWMAFDYGRGRWNTVTAHQSFTLHFLHNELRRTSRVVEYARVYLSILRSLRIGGVFAYAPGLPFIEAHLRSGEYAVRTVSVRDRVGDNATLSNFERETGVQLGAVTHIQRLA